MYTQSDVYAERLRRAFSERKLVIAYDSNAVVCEKNVYQTTLLFIVAIQHC